MTTYERLQAARNEIEFWNNVVDESAKYILEREADEIFFAAWRELMRLW